MFRVHDYKTEITESTQQTSFILLYQVEISTQWHLAYLYVAPPWVQAWLVAWRLTMVVQPFSLNFSCKDAIKSLNIGWSINLKVTELAVGSFLMDKSQIKQDYNMDNWCHKMFLKESLADSWRRIETKAQPWPTRLKLRFGVGTGSQEHCTRSIPFGLVHMKHAQCLYQPNWVYKQAIGWTSHLKEFKWDCVVGQTFVFCLSVVPKPTPRHCRLAQPGCILICLYCSALLHPKIASKNHKYFWKGFSIVFHLLGIKYDQIHPYAIDWFSKTHHFQNMFFLPSPLRTINDEFTGPCKKSEWSLYYMISCPNFEYQFSVFRHQNFQRILILHGHLFLTMDTRLNGQQNKNMRMSTAKRRKSIHSKHHL
ncbi:hypothetical protein VP01_2599g2 [Puccinia sorghi]|uniref:Uncharacterized protein n=1 Tax=Puccinia sorghi TaxID=27349 RepID=A0A0L6V4P4_9BASI|nr:hypothetical protein VP01_2599g2 [Puccinia sorghi]